MKKLPVLSVLLLAVLSIFIFVLPAQAQDDPFEPNHSRALANPVNFGGPNNNQVYWATSYDAGPNRAEIEPKDDKDWYKLEAVPDDTLMFELRPFITTLDLFFKLYYGDTFIAEKQSGGPGESEFFNFIVPPNSGGTYYVVVSSFGGTTTGNYRLMVTKKLARATSLKITYPQEPGVTMVAEQTYSLTWTSSGASIPGVKIELFKAGVWNQNINSNASNTGSYTWKIPKQTVFGSDYKIKITSVTDATLFAWSDNYIVIVNTAVPENNSATPTEFTLKQNYPNPFNPGTVIVYTLPQAGQVKLSIFDMLGRTVAIPVNERQGIGEHRASFDGTNFSAGMYFYRLEFNGTAIKTMGMVLAK